MKKIIIIILSVSLVVFITYFALKLISGNKDTNSLAPANSFPAGDSRASMGQGVYSTSPPEQTGAINDWGTK